VVSGSGSTGDVGLIKGDSVKLLKWTAATGAIAVGTILLANRKDIERFLKMHNM
jgi:hypothetical protein